MPEQSSVAAVGGDSTANTAIPPSPATDSGLHGGSGENAQVRYVRDQVAYEIGLYTERKRFNRVAAFAFTIVPATLAAFATVCIGASEKLRNQWLPIVAMVATGIASVLGAWEALFANRKLWRVNNIALTSLYKLRSDIEYRETYADRPITQGEADAYFARLRAIRAEGEKAYQRAVGAN